MGDCSYAGITGGVGRIEVAPMFGAVRALVAPGCLPLRSCGGWKQSERGKQEFRRDPSLSHRRMLHMARIVLWRLPGVNASCVIKVSMRGG